MQDFFHQNYHSLRFPQKPTHIKLQVDFYFLVHPRQKKPIYQKYHPDTAGQSEAYNRRRQERARQEQEKHNERNNDGNGESGGPAQMVFFDLGKPELVGEVDFCWVKSVRLEWVGKVS